LSRDDPCLLGAIREYRASPNRRISRNIREGLQNDFNAHIRNNSNADQYRYALYKIIGRLDVSRKNLKVAATTEDWLWTQLCLTREQKEQDTPQDRYDLQELATVLNKYGSERYDQKGTRPFAWFNLLLLTSQFEQVSYMSSKSCRADDRLLSTSTLSHNYGLKLFISLLLYITMGYSTCQEPTIQSCVSNATQRQVRADLQYRLKRRWTEQFSTWITRD
jgi:nuclear pore complex protein Nup93